MMPSQSPVRSEQNLPGSLPLHMQGVNGQVVPVQLAPSWASPTLIEKYPARRAKVLGIMQIVFGVASIATHFVGFLIVDFQDGNLLGQGIWCGTFLVLGGSFTIVAGQEKTRCLVRTSLVMSILASISAGLLLIFSLIACLQEAIRYRIYEAEIYRYYKQLVTVEPTTHQTTTYGWYNSDDAYNYDQRYPKGWLTEIQDKMSEQKSAVTISSILMVCGLVASIPAIWSAVLPCKVTCCKTDTEETGVEWCTVTNTPGAVLGRFMRTERDWRDSTSPSDCYVKPTSFTGSGSMPLQPGADGGGLPTVGMLPPSNAGSVNQVTQAASYPAQPACDSDPYTSPDDTQPLVDA